MLPVASAPLRGGRNRKPMLQQADAVVCPACCFKHKCSAVLVVYVVDGRRASKTFFG